MALRESGISLGVALRSLHSRNYRLFFSGQLISLIGTWMQNIALSWMVYRITKSAFMLGAVGFAGDIFSFLLMPVAGVLSDRLNRHRIIVATQTAAMVQAFVLAALVLTNRITVWEIFVLAMFLGLVNAFDMPTRQAFVVEMLESKSDLQNAIALNSTIFNGARLLGPSIAGVLIAAVGEGWCFFINGASFIAVIAALLAMRLPKHKARPEYPNITHELREGFSYAFGFLPIRNIIMLLAVVSLVGMSYLVLMPVLARDILHGGPKTMGFLMGTSGVGALVAAVLLASRKSVLGLGRMIPLAAILFGCGLVALAFSHNFYLSAPIMLFMGFGMMTQMASSNTMIQTIVDDDKRGRVMSIYTMAFRGITPFGSLLAGTLASRLGALNALLIGGGSVITAAGLFAKGLPELRQQVRPIYVREGIITEMAKGIKSASDYAVPPEDENRA